MSRQPTATIELTVLLVELAQVVTGIEDPEEALRTLILDEVNRAAGGQPARATQPPPAPPEDEATDEPSPTARVVSGLTWEEYQRHLDMTRGPEAVSRMSLMSTPTPPAPAPPEDEATDEPSPAALPPDMVQRRILFGERLRAAREARGMTQDALAQLLGLTRAQVSRMEMGNRGPSFDSLIAIRRILDVYLEDL